MNAVRSSRLARARRPLAALAWLAGLAFAAAAPARAQVTEAPLGDNEYYIRTHAKMGDVHLPSVRTRAMGGAGTALSNGAASVVENPAALGALAGKGIEVQLGYQSLDDGDSDATEMVYRLGGAMSLSPYIDDANNTSVGLAYTRRDQDDALTTGQFDQDSFTIAYGSNYGPNLLWGVALSAYDGTHEYKYNSLRDRDITTFTGGELSLGVLYRLGDDFTVGATGFFGGGRARSKRTYTGGATPTETRRSGDMDSYGLRAGAAWQLSESTLFAGDIGIRQMNTEIPTLEDETNEFNLALGVEHTLIPQSLVARAGVSYNKVKYKFKGDTATIQRTGAKEDDDYLAFNAGVGARLGRADLNWALDVRNNGDIGNFFSATFGF